MRGVTDVLVGSQNPGKVVDKTEALGIGGMCTSLEITGLG